MPSPERPDEKRFPDGGSPPSSIPVLEDLFLLFLVFASLRDRVAVILSPLVFQGRFSTYRPRIPRFQGGGPSARSTARRSSHERGFLDIIASKLLVPEGAVPG
jgi:hypothetical protein